MGKTGAAVSAAQSVELLLGEVLNRPTHAADEGATLKTLADDRASAFPAPFVQGAPVAANIPRGRFGGQPPSAVFVLTFGGMVGSLHR